ncbi:MAG: UTP--glucose-1-phosphate uridylyltransferase, partial [Planctomycetota bacterium]
MSHLPHDLLLELHRHRQEHLVRFWDQLSPDQQRQLCQQIRDIDFDQIRRLWLKASGQSYSEFTSPSRANRAKAPASVVRQPEDDSSRSRWLNAVSRGEQELRNHRVAVITVAGGQGTRLGFDHPKGLFPIGPVTDRSLFQIFAEQILARRNRHSCRIPWFIMTSDATHDETITFFRSKNFFGLAENSVH